MIKVNLCCDRQNPSFSAHFVMKVPIQKYSAAEKTYKSFDAELIKLDQKIPQDINFVKDVCESEDFNTWGKYLFGLWQNKTWNRPNVISNSVYALVKPQQDKNYEKINPDDVLGITEFVEHKPENNPANQIMFLITKQQYQKVNRTETSEYTDIGKGMTDALKALYAQKPIAGFSVLESVEFWQKQGFQNKNQRSLIYNG